MLPKLVRRFAVVCSLLLCCGSALAHGGLQGSQSLWGGALHFLTSAVSLAALAAMLAVLFGIAERLALGVAAVAGASAGIASALAEVLPVYTAPSVLVMVGLTAVLGWKPSRTGSILIAALTGLAAGLAADLDAPSWAGGTGVACTAMFVSGCALAVSRDLASVPKLAYIVPVAKRVLGSWVAAIGMLMAALAIHLGKG